MREIATEIEIKASPEKIWAILMDFPKYPEWNPFIKSVTGSSKTGSQLKVLLQPPGARGMEFEPIVLKSVPGHEFRWKGKLFMNGLFDGEHAFIIELRSGAVRFTQKEKFTGRLVPMMFTMIGAQTLRGFEAMNTALKERAEKVTPVPAAA
ncbi:MAG TPA: SRPBCC domain-containing protein [Candidatus Kapabacteria bacterium]|nr:SRPBCC domain-containing protein [Candidatus Kapabacteria bacterium]